MKERTVTIPLADAEKNLATLVARVEAGEEIVLTKDGRAVVRMTSVGVNHDLIERRRKARGSLKGQIWIADDFDELGPEWDPYI
jgi:prevent-host-death family protein